MINPKSKIGYSNRGLANYNLKNYSESIKDFTAAIEIDSNDSESYLYRGLANYNLKNYIESIKNFTSAIEIDSNDSKSYFYRGNAKLLLKKPKEACLDWEKAKKLGEKTVIQIIDKYCK